MAILHNIPKQIKSVADKYNLTLTKSKQDMSADFWAIGTNWIIRHDALTKIGKQEGVIFHTPKVEVLGGDNFYGVAIYGEAELEGYKIWTTADATRDNVKGKGGYFFNMAEKRWKDRCTLKLLDLYEYGLYSDIEADAFRNQTQTTYSNDKASDYMKNNIRQVFVAKGVYKKADAEVILRGLSKTDGQKIKETMESGKIDQAVEDFYKLNKGM